MKVKVIVGGLSLLTVFFSQAESLWLSSLKIAKKKALEENRLILANVLKADCSICETGHQVWTDPEIQYLMNQVVPVQVNAKYPGPDAASLGDLSDTEIILLNAFGDVFAVHHGTITAVELKKLLKSVPPDVQRLNEALGQFLITEENPTLSQEVATCLQEYGKKSLDAVRNALLEHSDRYFEITYKLAKKEKDDRLAEHAKISLALNEVYKGNARLALESLKKMKIGKINTSNLGLMHFAYIEAYRADNNEKESSGHIDRLALVPGGSVLLRKLEE
ncbi:MAG: hypothetical protein KI790_03435 [Cyclobacteriaceae bacterium]|nr:hypothetical protein [Cyclobacteriaceae bacterium HetDA_MAG_MS6]